jgi:hypothetical protein
VSAQADRPSQVRNSGRSGRRDLPAGLWRAFPGLAVALLGLLAFPSLAGADPRAVEYGVKAVFLERFARFVEWPPEAQGEPGTPFRITVLGDDPFRGLLEQAYASRQIRGRPVEIRHAARPSELGPCHLLFISGSVARHLDEVLIRLRGQPVLLVGDTDGFGEGGVHLNFFLEADKVRFELNPGALRQAGLGASYLLQQVARPVETRGGAR